MPEKNKKNIKESQYWIIKTTLPTISAGEQYMLFQQLHFDLKMSYSFGYTEEFLGKICLKFYCYFAEKQSELTLRSVLKKSSLILLDPESKIKHNELMINEQRIMNGPWENGTMSDACKKFLKRAKVHAKYLDFIKMCDQYESQKQNILEVKQIQLFTLKIKRPENLNTLKIYFDFGSNKQDRISQQKSSNYQNVSFYNFVNNQNSDNIKRDEQEYQRKVQTHYPNYIPEQEVLLSNLYDDLSDLTDFKALGNDINMKKQKPKDN